MTSTVRKAVIPAAGLGTRFLPATKAQPKEMLPVVDKPAIQYVVEEAVARRHRRHPDHHRPRQAQPRGPLRPALRARGTRSRRRASTTSSSEVRGLADLADIHYVRQGEPLGLGHAVSVARKHVGDEPVRRACSATTSWTTRSTVLEDMIAAYERARRARSWRSRRSRPRRSRPTAAPTPEPTDERRPGAAARHRREAGARGRARPTWRSWAATCSPRRSSTRSTGTKPGVGGEIQLTDAIALLLDRAAGVRLRVRRGPLRHRQEARLPAGHGRAGARPRRPRPRVPRASSPTSSAGEASSDRRRRSGSDGALVPLDEAPRPRARPAARRSAPVPVPPPTRSGCVLGGGRGGGRGDPAVRQHRDGRLRRAGRRHRRRARSTLPRGGRGRGRAPGRPSRSGRARRCGS